MRAQELLQEAGQVPAQLQVRVQQLLQEEMEHAADLKVKLEVEAKRGASWYDAK